MRPVRCNVAASLDGYIAGPRGEFNWIPQDPAVDFGAIFGKVDTVLLGRRSWEVVRETGSAPWGPGTRVYVFSRTLGTVDDPGVTLVADDAEGVVVTVVPILLGGGVPLFPPGPGRVPLHLDETRRYPSGMVTLSYSPIQ